MTRQKDLKSLIRARMEKTGESYTAARKQLLARKPPAEPSGTIDAPPPQGASPSRESKPAERSYAALAGMTDAVIQARTGCDWKAWVEALDYAGAADWSHRAIAEHLGRKFGVGAWWCQAVTVGYERIKGLREIGQRRGASDRSFEANKSRTFAVPVAELYRAWAEAKRRKKWLPETGITVRAATADRSLRLTWSDGSSVELWFVAKAPARSTVQIQHRKLGSKADAEARKTWWSERLDRLATHLARTERGGA